MRGKRVKALRKELKKYRTTLTKRGWRKVKRDYNKGFTVEQSLQELFQTELREGNVRIDPAAGGKA